MINYYQKRANQVNRAEQENLAMSVFSLVGMQKLYKGQRYSLFKDNKQLHYSDGVRVSVPRSPPRPSPGSLHYSDEDVSTKYNDLIPAESSSLTEKPSEISDSQVQYFTSYGLCM